MNDKYDASLSTSVGHKLGASSHLDRHYYALQAEYEESLRGVGFPIGSKILDAGSGNGLFLPMLSQIVGPSGHICALDLAPENVKAIEDKAEAGVFACPVDTKVGDIASLSYNDNQFDGLWSANVSQYLTDAQLSQTMREFARVVKPHGLIAVKEVDISVWQFQPQDPKLMWRLLQALADDTQMSGAMRGTRLPVWFREAKLADIWSRTTLTERRQPLRLVERDYIRGNLEFLSSMAARQKLSADDAKEWKAIAERPDHLLEDPDFCYRELYVVTGGFVP